MFKINRKQDYFSLRVFQFFKYEGPHDAVAYDKTQQTDVAQQKAQHLSHEFETNGTFCRGGQFRFLVIIYRCARHLSSKTCKNCNQKSCCIMYQKCIWNENSENTPTKQNTFINVFRSGWSVNAIKLKWLVGKCIPTCCILISCTLMLGLFFAVVALVFTILTWKMQFVWNFLLRCFPHFVLFFGVVFHSILLRQS